MADIEGDANNNTLNGTSGQDSIQGNGGNDTIDGGSGDDTVLGGDGDDSITGGAGDDVIVGGRGNDTLSAGNSSPSDTFVYRDGDGSDVITDFDPPEPDIISFHMDELTSFQDVQDRITTDGPDTLITFDNGDSIRLLNVNPANLSATNFTFNTGPICFHAGTWLKTATGPRRVEALRVGDLVITADHGLQPIRMITEQSLHFTGKAEKDNPILIKARALDGTAPACDLVLSPQHRVLVCDPQSREDVLVAACKLTGRNGVRRMRGRRAAYYFNLLFDCHEIVFANGCAVESLLLTPYARAALPQYTFARARVRRMIPARPIVRQDPQKRAVALC
ncbi:MAG: Hint domain-containing protein [Roseovarius sp.]